jgi:hypothetical protein
MLNPEGRVTIQQIRIAECEVGSATGSNGIVELKRQ